MKRLLTFIVLPLLVLTSCFQKEHVISELKIIGDSPDMNNQIQFCLEEEIGYSSYLIKFDITLNDGVNFKVQDIIHSTGHSEEKCFDKFLSTSFTHRHTTDQEKEKILGIYSGNVKKIVVTIYDEHEKEKISTKAFNNL
jgi:hypothetical protein